MKQEHKQESWELTKEYKKDIFFIIKLVLSKKLFFQIQFEFISSHGI